MICVYPAACTDFSGNGLGVVQPQSCTVTETLNGEWERTLVHPIDEYGKWTRLSEGNILRAPVPAAMTPRIRISVPGEDTRLDVYQVDTDTVSYTHLRAHETGRNLVCRLLLEKKKNKER